MPARYPRGRRERGNIFIALRQREVGGSKTDGEPRRGDEARSVRREVELRVIEKPVVHPDRRFISLVHALTVYTESFSPIISPFYPLPSSRRRLLSRSLTFRTSDEERREKAAEVKRGARRADARRGELARGRQERKGGRGGEGERKKKEEKIVRNNARGGAFSRDY